MKIVDTAIYDLAFKHMPAIFILWEHEKNLITLLNNYHTTLLGYQNINDNITLEAFLTWIHPDEHAQISSLSDMMGIRDVGDTVDISYRMIDKNNITIWVNANHLLLKKDHQGSALQTLTVIRDARDFKLITDALERKSHELESILFATPDTYLRFDKQQKIKRVFNTNFNFQVNSNVAMLEKTLEEVLPLSTYKQIKPLIELTIQNKKIFTKQFLYPNNPDESFEIRILPFLRDEYMLVLRDIRERARVEAEVIEQKAISIQSSKMAALGQMAASVAHEINTPLSVIQTSATLIEKKLKQDTCNHALQVNEKTTIIKQTTEKISGIIKSLRVFAHHDEQENMQLTQISLLEVVDQTLSLCIDRLKGASVRLERLPIPPDLFVVGQASAIIQILLNLLNNSYDAIETIPVKWIKLGAEKKGSQIEISVTDCGQGIPATVKDRIFDLFFTTKDVGKGTGLGLGISKQLAKKMNGDLVIDDQNANTRFILKLNSV